MLVLKRYIGSRVRLRTIGGEEIWITLFRNRNGALMLGFDAPQSVEVVREELLEFQPPAAGVAGP